MVERFIKNELILKRWRAFKSVKRALVGAVLVAFYIFISLTAEFWANSKPIVFSFSGSIYFPVLKNYHPSAFGQEESAITDYRALQMDWALWPLIRWDPFESNNTLSTFPGAPSPANWFGTDDRGRDVLSRLVYGFRYSFGFAVLVWLFSFSAGTTFGAVMGYFGGKTDLIGQRAVEVFEALPRLMILLTLIAMVGGSLWLLVTFSVLLGWMSISTYMRAEFLRLRKRDFVEAARAQGVGTGRILFQHILPNALAPLITFSPTEIAANISILAALDYLGMGLPPPTPSWGELLGQSQSYFTIAWWLAVYPAAAVVLALTSLTFIGEGVRAAYDPRKAAV
jgi:microcin C transport system permease protein